jgi:hypothetical protein
MEAEEGSAAKGMRRSSDLYPTTQSLYPSYLSELSTTKNLGLVPPFPVCRPRFMTKKEGFCLCSNPVLGIRKA